MWVSHLQCIFSMEKLKTLTFLKINSTYRKLNFGKQKISPKQPNYCTTWFWWTKNSPNLCLDVIQTGILLVTNWFSCCRTNILIVFHFFEQAAPSSSLINLSLRCIYYSRGHTGWPPWWYGSRLEQAYS